VAVVPIIVSVQITRGLLIGFLKAGLSASGPFVIGLTVGYGDYRGRLAHEKAA
jgi:hypothetical protein